MIKKKLLDEITGLIGQAIEREKKFIDHCKTGDGHDNPQVITMRNKAEGKLAALEDVNDALTRGDLACLRIEAKGLIS